MQKRFYGDVPFMSFRLTLVLAVLLPLHAVLSLLLCWSELLTDGLACLFPDYEEDSSVTFSWGKDGR